jgi:hypothetical protein
MCKSLFGTFEPQKDRKYCGCNKGFVGLDPFDVLLQSYEFDLGSCQELGLILLVSVGLRKGSDNFERCFEKLADADNDAKRFRLAKRNGQYPLSSMYSANIP